MWDCQEAIRQKGPKCAASGLFRGTLEQTDCCLGVFETVINLVDIATKVWQPLRERKAGFRLRNSEFQAAIIR